MDKFLTFPGLLLPLMGLALLASCGADARVAKETPLLTRALPDMPGREVLIETVVLAPGKVVPAHRYYSDATAAMPWPQRILFSLFTFTIIGLFTFIGIATPGVGWFLYVFLGVQLPEGAD